MFRASLCLRRALDEALTKVQKVWNMDFAGTPTTKDLMFYEKPASSTPLYHVVDLDGTVVSPTGEPEVPKEVLVKMMETMLRQHTIDAMLMKAQRQGRIAFYLTCFGEEAAVVGAAAALQICDEVFLQYREAALLTYRGYTIQEMVAQCIGNVENEMKGRQMPIHYGSRKLNVHMISSPLATHVPHGTGAGYAFRLENEQQKDASKKRIAAVFCGEGATSEGDFYAGLNFAAAMGSNTLYVVRNNGYAISTPTRSQYCGDGVLAHGTSCGIPSARVDGHDVLAVIQTVRRARDIILTTNRPVLVEAMTYRVSHHSSSDDSLAYRSRDEVEYFAKTLSPIARFEKYMMKKALWSPAQSEALVQQVRQEVLEELRRQEKLPMWPLETLHDDVYKIMTPELREAQRELEEHYARNSELYKE